MWESADFIEVSVRRNSVTPVGFEIWDEVADIAADLSGYSISCLVATADGETALETIAVQNYTASLGLFDINFDGSLYSDVLGTKESVNLSIQVIASNFSETVTLASGRIILKPGIN